MKVLIVEQLRKPYVKEIDGSLKSMQDIVGGLIQVIYPFEDSEVALVCNDEGKLIGLPLNRALYDSNGKMYDIVLGIFFICQAPEDSDSFESLTDEQVKMYTEKFSKSEIWL